MKAKEFAKKKVVEEGIELSTQSKLGRKFLYYLRALNAFYAKHHKEYEDTEHWPPMFKGESMCIDDRLRETGYIKFVKV